MITTRDASSERFRVDLFDRQVCMPIFNQLYCLGNQLWDSDRFLEMCVRLKTAKIGGEKMFEYFICSTASFWGFLRGGDSLLLIFFFFFLMQNCNWPFYQLNSIKIKMKMIQSRMLRCLQRYEFQHRYVSPFLYYFYNTIFVWVNIRGV